MFFICIGHIEILYTISLRFFVYNCFLNNDETNEWKIIYKIPCHCCCLLWTFKKKYQLLYKRYFDCSHPFYSRFSDFIVWFGRLEEKKRTNSRCLLFFSSIAIFYARSKAWIAKKKKRNYLVSLCNFTIVYFCNFLFYFKIFTFFCFSFPFPF